MIAVAYCRGGFEGEAAIDIARVAHAAGATSAATPIGGSGYVVAALEGVDLAKWRRALAMAPPIFVRSLFVGTGPHPLFASAGASGAGTTSGR